MKRFLLPISSWMLTMATALCAEPLDYNRDIRPILSDACFACHGFDAKHREAGLRLDQRESALAKLESGAVAIEPGKPEASELIARIISTDADTKMPPEKSGKKISEAQLAKLKQWIAEGAKYQTHWSFVNPVRPATPTVKNAAWVKNEIDAFVLARLEKEGLAPSPEADKATLLRRLSLDLIGLPPTIEELDAFLKDHSPTAYEAQVDRLLKSPHYGERMAMNWLDFARYADSNGFQTDSSRQMWPWRDWVINAFNTNQPFDQFTIEQLAGDLLPEPRLDQIVATGFNRNHRINGEGGIIGEEWRVENIMDRVETTGLTWMALTVNCCRCHDHKYDPITQKEFYQFFAFFNNVAESGTITGASNRQGGNSEPIVSVASAEHQAEQQQLKEKLAKAEQELAAAKKGIAAWQTAWEEKFREEAKAQPKTWQLLDAPTVESTEKTEFKRESDGTWLATGNNPTHDTYVITSPLSAGKLSGVLLETFPHPSLPNQSLGRYSNGNYVLSAVEVEISAPSLAKPVTGKIARVAADYSQKGWEISLLLDGNPNNGWAVDGPTRRAPCKAMFVLETPLAVPEQASLTVRLKHDALGGHNIGRFRLSTSGVEPALVELQTGDSQKILAILNLPEKKRNKNQREELQMFLRTVSDYPLTGLEKAVAEAKKSLEELSGKFPTCMVMKELDKPRETFFLIRGQYDNRGESVTAGLPAALPPLPSGEPMNRLGLARWLVSKEHPLTPRVWVNRQWERLFGVGIVKSSENFGLQSEFPSHPELLDWLAVEFRDGGWDMKAMLKRLVMSATYRQASSVTPQLWERDPENRLLARGPRFRLSAELIRDQALAVSGLFTAKIGGPSVRPYMPEGVWDETSVYGDMLRYKHDSGENLYRRTMYTIWKRTAAPPTMLMFDSPSREFCTVKRSRTNTPLQALALLNEVTFVEAARTLGEKMLSQSGSPADRLSLAFRAATSRVPHAEELRILNAGLERRLAKYKADPEAAKKLLSVGERKISPNVDVAELAAYTLTANVILNLDETVTKE